MDSRTLFFFWIALGIITLLAVLNHAPWRDESHAWLLVQDHPQVLDLIHAARYEGSPPLWHFILLGLQAAQLPIQSMGWAAWIISWASAGMLLFWSPFPKWERLLLAAGYYFVFEYTVIARNYALTIFFLFLIAALWRNDSKTKSVDLSPFRKWLHDTPAINFLVHVGLAASSAFGLWMAICILGFEWWNNSNKSKTKSTGVILRAIIFVTLILFLLPPADLGEQFLPFHSGGGIAKIIEVSQVVLAGLFPIVSSAQWSASFFSSIPWFLTLGGAIIALAFIFRMRISREKKWLVGAMAGGLLLIFAVSRTSGFRHWGLIWMIIIFGSWIGFHEFKKEISTQMKKWANWIWRAWLVVHVIAGISALLIASQIPFSQSHSVAQWAEMNGVQLQQMAFFPAYIGEGVAGSMRYQKGFFQPETGEWKRYVDWTQANYLGGRKDLSELVNTWKAMAASEHPPLPIYWITNHPLARPDLIERAVFRPAWVQDESFWVYEMANP